MLDITEANELICQQLDKHHLALCARVNKKWHGNVVRHLWRDIDFKWNPEENILAKQRKAFRRVVLEDYLLEQQRSSSRSIRKKNIPPHDDDTRPQQPGQETVPTALQLLRHLYQHCPSFQVPLLSLSITEEHKPDDVLKTIEEFVLPRVHTLVLTARLYTRSERWRVQYILDRCSRMVELTVQEINISYTEDEKNDKEEEQQQEEGQQREEEHQQEEHKVWPKFKTLSLRRVSRQSVLAVVVETMRTFGVNGGETNRRTCPEFSGRYIGPPHAQTQGYYPRTDVLD
ncbi:hypothetical protein BGZ65_004979 [Modicella reniformis]|uniref:F-box domain-containing protein n=1 Tax=Modicella reniformis TaxID=1440133 RepID=A0A9P6ST95_9FUNG|nr:hypothetical protein BGZ65_004979 [Modicella reniformis]